MPKILYHISIEKSVLILRRENNMAKDDYYVIVYKILAYLYVQLKKGEPIDPKRSDGKLNSSDHMSMTGNYLCKG